MNRFLSQLLKGFLDPAEIPDLKIKGLCLDSRQLKPGDLFFAYPGLEVDGRVFIQEAYEKGAAAIVLEAQGSEAFSENLQDLENKVILLKISELSKHLSEIASRYYGNPSQKMKIIGVTGTNGKTSCTHFIAHALTSMGIKSAVMGTLGTGVLPHLKSSSHTTLDPISVQRELAELELEHVKVVAMEVTSHALVQYRVSAVNFEIAVFTQLSQDHLDYHGNMENYAAAKARLFEFPYLKSAILNLDDSYGRDWALRFQSELKIIGYTQEARKFPQDALVSATDIQIKSSGYELNLETPWGQSNLNLPLLGRFNISNVLAVAGVLGVLDCPFSEITANLSRLKSVPGRMQILGGEAGLPTVVVDYAHTPDALEKTLSTLRENCRGKLWCVFGCGGDRDRLKRPIMGSIAESCADQVVLTSDNPRTEDPLEILKEIQGGFNSLGYVKTLEERREAIKFAIQTATADDMILLAGKGHEDYQIIGREKLKFSDIEEVQHYLDERAHEIIKSS